jgi:hypothetical protein
MAETVSSRKLDTLLKKDPAFRKAAQKVVHRVTLSRYRNGHWTPTIEKAIGLEKVSNGRIRVRGWDEKVPSHRGT